MKSNLETQKIEVVELANSFEVEELEERVELGKWSAQVKGGYSDEKGGYAEAGVSLTF